MTDPDRSANHRNGKNAEELAAERTDLSEDRTVLAHERSFASWLRTGLGAQSAQQVAGLCGQACRFLTMHHTIEDQNLFPAVASLEAYAPVAARLAEEHLVVHAHLERVDDLALAVLADPARVDELVAAVADLRTDLESHFAYEEAEMTEPLGLLGLGV